MISQDPGCTKMVECFSHRSGLSEFLIKGTYAVWWYGNTRIVLRNKRTSVMRAHAARGDLRFDHSERCNRHDAVSILCIVHLKQFGQQIWWNRMDKRRWSIGEHIRSGIYQGLLFGNIDTIYDMADHPPVSGLRIAAGHILYTLSLTDSISGGAVLPVIAHDRIDGSGHCSDVFRYSHGNLLNI